MATVGIAVTASWDVLELVGLSQSATWDVAAPTPTAADDDRCGAFRHLTVDHLVAGNSRVAWELRESFAVNPRPYTCQLQVGGTGTSAADDWVDVGPAVQNTYTLTDPYRRALGKQLTVHYRVKLTDGNGVVHYSPPAAALGGLDFREWTQAREILRQESLRLRSQAGVRGFLLKRRRDGAPCPRCLDPFTGDVTDSRCPVCLGTRFQAGYFRAVPGVYSDVGNWEGHEVRAADDAPSNMTLSGKISGRFLGNPLLSSGDVWVDADSDLRYEVGRLAVNARLRGVPLVITAELTQFAFDHVVYGIPLEGT